ncbi:MAG: hypothetical protein R3A46_09775 [Thermomicrobiales bacterium]
MSQCVDVLRRNVSSSRSAMLRPRSARLPSADLDLAQRLEISQDIAGDEDRVRADLLGSRRGLPESGPWLDPERSFSA